MWAAGAAASGIAGGAGRIELSPVTGRSYGTMPDGTPIELFSLANRKQMRVEVISYGGAIVSLSVPDRSGVLADVVLGKNDLEGYLEQTAHFGAIIGRYANRIARGRFSLGGKVYELPQNNHGNTLHGGPRGFDKHAWTAAKASTPDGEGVVLSHMSEDGDEGFPGNLLVRVLYSLNDDNELKIDYTATTDRLTVVNLTNHSYFNLAGQGQGDVLQHRVAINAGRFTPVDEALIPTGELRNVKGTPFDFTKAAPIGARIAEDNEQLRFGRGYDHNWVLNSTGALSKAAEIYEPQSGRVMEVWTTEPGMQFYTANSLDGSIRGKGGKVYPRFGAFCMETQPLSGFTEQARFSVHGIAARGDVSLDDDVPVFGAVTGGLVRQRRVETSLDAADTSVCVTGS